MSLIDLADKAKDVKEPQTQPDGRYKLSIIKLKDGTSGENAQVPGAPYTMVYYRIENPKESPAALISECLMHVTENTPDDQVEMRALGLKRFMTAFKLTKADLAEANYPKLSGRTAWADVVEKDDPEYGLQNSVKKWISAD